MSTKSKVMAERLPENMATAALADVRAMRERGGDMSGWRVHFPKGAINVAEIRSKLGLTQSDFAARFGLNLHSVVQWEQGKRQPEGAARVLLTLIDIDPKTVQKLVKKAGLSEVHP